MRIRPEELTVSDLPRSPLPGGIKADAAADLLQRAAWDYRTVLGQARQLAKAVEEQALRIEEQAVRIEELEAQIASLETRAAPRRDPDELARRVLASTHQTAREEREEARREGELLLKKAERRAERIELEARRRIEAEIAQLDHLESVRQELCARLRSSLEAIKELGT